MTAWSNVISAVSAAIITMLAVESMMVKPLEVEITQIKVELALAREVAKETEMRLNSRTEEEAKNWRDSQRKEKP